MFFCEITLFVIASSKGIKTTLQTVNKDCRLKMADKRPHKVIIFTNLSFFPYDIYLFKRNILPLASNSLFIYLLGVGGGSCNRVY